MDDLTTWNILVGKVVGRWDHSNLKIASIDASPGRFKTGSRLCLEDKGGFRRLVEVLSGRAQGNAWICDVGILALEEAEALRGATLWIHPSMRPKLPEGEFYLDEIIGMRVVTESGEDWGEVQEVLENPAHNIYVTPVAMIPGHPEFIVSTDWDARVLCVRDLPGLKTVAGDR